MVCLPPLARLDKLAEMGRVEENCSLEGLDGVAEMVGLEKDQCVAGMGETSISQSCAGDPSDCGFCGGAFWGVYDRA